MKILTALGLGLMIGAGSARAQPVYLPPPPPSEPSPAVTDARVRAETKPIVASKIILVGDSTTQVGSGWGGAFCAYHLVSRVACVDLARGGRSTFDYRAEGSWKIALSEMQTAGYSKVYVLIQFGHNDQPGKPGRSTDLYTEFPANLRGYVTEARSVGAIPILITPLTRRIFKEGSLQDTLKPWAEAVRGVAAELNVPLVDLHAMSVATVQKMGAEAALNLSQAEPPQGVVEAAATGTTIIPPKVEPLPADSVTANEPSDAPMGRLRPAFDYTHLGTSGAALFSAQVTEGLAKAVPELRSSLIP